MFRILEKLLISVLITLSLSGLSYSAEVDNKSALIIIDMQLPFVTRSGNAEEPKNVKKVEEILAKQIEAIKLARQSNMPIIFMEYKDFGETNPKLKQATAGYSKVVSFVKNTDGMFADYNQTKAIIKSYLSSNKIKNLIITGANGGACVQESIRGALDNNYNVTAISKAIADFNYPEFIYPYAKIYSFTPHCRDCKFKEVESTETVALDLAIKQLDNISENGQVIDNSKRDNKSFKPEINRAGSVQGESNSASK